MIAGGLRAAGLGRRFLGVLYEAFLLFAVALIATLPFWLLFGDSTHGSRLYLLRAWLLAVIGTYLVFFWTRGGQTLPMKTWHMAVVRAEDGGPVLLFRAVHRFLLAILSTLALGLGFLWAFVDRDRQFLHDRLAGTAIVIR